MKLTYSSFELWNIFTTLPTKLHLDYTIWKSLKLAGIAKFVSRRGCRAGQNKQRRITTVLGYGKYNSSFTGLSAKPYFSNYYSSNRFFDSNMQIYSVEQNNINNRNNTTNYARRNNLSYVKKCQQLLPTTKQLCFAVANVRSARNKTALIIDHVIGNTIDLCVLTETWLKDDDSVSISSLSPSGYLFDNCPRPSQRIGGGIGLMHRDNLQTSRTDSGEKRSFEFCEWNITNLSRPLKIIGIYRPPYSEAHPVSAKVFFEEFSDYLENIIMCPEVLLISGDFNFHLDSHTSIVSFYNSLTIQA